MFARQVVVRAVKGDLIRQRQLLGERRPGAALARVFQEGQFRI
jgi:hypothetical protein